jgi:hypothetical protein
MLQLKPQDLRRCWNQAALSLVMLTRQNEQPIKGVYLERWEEGEFTPPSSQAQP